MVLLPSRPLARGLYYLLLSSELLSLLCETDQWDNALNSLTAAAPPRAEGGEADGLVRAEAGVGAGGEEEAVVFHDLWLGDSVESGVGPNIQVRAHSLSLTRTRTRTRTHKHNHTHTHTHSHTR